MKAKRRADILIWIGVCSEVIDGILKTDILETICTRLTQLVLELLMIRAATAD
jgi:hypothetical protein